MATVAQPLDTVREFPTPEHIAFRFRLAGPAARAAAYALDAVFRGLLLLGFGFIVMLLGFSGFGHASFGLWLLASFFVDWLAGGLCEWLWNGATPGKRILGIRVVSVDGLPAGAVACLLRNLLRAADWLPFGFAVGLTSLGLSPSFQRLGDLAAGTLVIYDRSRRPGKVAPAEAAAVALAESVPAEALAALDGQATRAIALYVARRRRYGKSLRNQLAAHLARPMAARFGLPARDPDLLLCALHHRLTRVDTAAGAGGRAAAFLAARRPRWRRLDELVGGRLRRGAIERPIELARLYRSACADLALAEAYHLPASDVERLHELVASAHLRFYRRVAISWRRLRWLAFTRVPALLYGDGCLRVALLCFYGLFTAAMLASWADPTLASGWLGDRLDDLRDMYAKAPRDRDIDDGVEMYGFYVWNNVGIALGSFAAGIFAGVGSLVTLVFNGLYLGFAYGGMLAGEEPNRSHFLEFTAAHGPFELTGITLAGAAGLRLGLGPIVARGLPRLDALRRSAAEAAPIMAVAAVLVAAAAPIEGFLSPSALPVAVKQAVGALCAALIAAYLVGLGRRGRRLGAHLPGAAPPDADDEDTP